MIICMHEANDEPNPICKLATGEEYLPPDKQDECGIYIVGITQKQYNYALSQRTGDLSNDIFALAEDNWTPVLVIVYDKENNPIHYL